MKMAIKPRLKINNSGLSLSEYLLIAANLIPLIGVLFFAWDTQVVLALYWFENLVIGLFNVVKMLVTSLLHKTFEGAFLIVFFIAHYGIFCMAHGSLLAEIIGFKELVAAAEANYSSSWIVVELFHSLMSTVNIFIEQLSPMILYGLAALFLSRLASFIEYFLLRGELFKTDVKKLMGAPYGQIIIMHVGLLIGGLLLQKLQSPVWLLVVIVLFKMMVDYHQHKKRHIKSQLQELDEIGE